MKDDDKGGDEDGGEGIDEGSDEGEFLRSFKEEKQGDGHW